MEGRKVFLKFKSMNALDRLSHPSLLDVTICSCSTLFGTKYFMFFFSKISIKLLALSVLSHVITCQTIWSLHHLVLLWEWHKRTVEPCLWGCGGRLFIKVEILLSSRFLKRKEKQHQPQKMSCPFLCLGFQAGCSHCYLISLGIHLPMCQVEAQISYSTCLLSHLFGFWRPAHLAHYRRRINPYCIARQGREFFGNH